MSALADVSVVKDRFGTERDEARKELTDERLVRKALQKQLTTAREELTDERKSRKAHHAELRDTIAWYRDAAQHAATLYTEERKAREDREAQEAN